MKILHSTKSLALLVFASLGMLHVASVHADAGDSIANRATIDYQVGGVAQTPVESSPGGNATPGVGNGADTTFVEDREINFTVAESGTIGYEDVSPGATAAGNGVALVYTLTNNSNEVMDFLLAAIDTDVDTHGGGADDFDATGVQVFVEDGTTAGYQQAEDTAVFIDELAVGAAATVYIVGDIPAGATDGQTAGYALVGQAAAGGGASTEGAAITNDDNGNVSPAGSYSNGGTAVVAGTANDIADNPATVQTVFNDPAGANAEDVNSQGAQDGQYNGQSADSDAFRIVAAQLTVTKDSTVIDDPVNGTTNPKAIPGATLEYTVTIANGAGAGVAQGVAITDDLDNEITTLGNLAWVAGSMEITAPTINGGAPQTLTDASSDDEGEFNDTAGNRTVTARCGDLAASESCTLTFELTVQ